jgi:two-component system phosphate regulon sensor histidine kinase PhoR
MAARSWKFHSTRWLSIATLLLVIGWLTDYLVWTITLTLGAYSLWHIVNAWRLNVWMRNPDREIPESRGIWREIFDGIKDKQKQILNQKQQHISMIGDFQNLTDAFPDATLVINQEGRITWFNTAAEEQLGLKKPGDFGQAVTNLLRSSVFFEWFTAQNGNRKPLHIPSPQNENIWLEVSTVDFRLDQTLIILRDITEFHNVEQIRRDFVANISHELRSPLTVILGYLELLQDHPEKSVSMAVDRMLGQAAQTQVLLNDLLELSKLQSDEVHGIEEEIDIPAVLKQLKEQTEELSQGRHEFFFDIQPDLRLSDITANLESAFSNLIANAVKYTPDGGKIRVGWGDSPDGPQLTIRDSGIGIPNRDIPRVTERFYRVGSDRARQTGGSGLGLAIVKHALNSHDATLLIESELGEGSTFTCTFPISRRLPGASPDSVL